MRSNPEFERPSGIIYPERVDLAKLCPAPWHVDSQGGISGPFPDPPRHCDQRTALEFSCLARNAHDVMMRRSWFPRFCGVVDGKQRWVAYSWIGLRDVSSIPFPSLKETEKVGFICDDPYTALVEADAWYRQTIESKASA